MSTSPSAADFVVCPHCTLNHSVKPDGHCPRCRKHPNDEVVESASSGGGAFELEKSALNAGAMGGIGIMALAAVWFVGGYAAGYIFYYPPILFLIGLASTLKAVFADDD